MSAGERYVRTKEIQDAVKGRESAVLTALGIHWDGKSSHIRCPYPDHEDQHPSWRWNQAKRRAYCTCTRSASIFGIDVSKSVLSVTPARSSSLFERRRTSSTASLI